jgi:hypothetical protein
MEVDMEVKMTKTLLISSILLFAGSLLAMGKTEITKLKTTLHEQSGIIFNATTSAENQLAAIADAQAIIAQFRKAAASGRTSEHLFVEIRVEGIKITESTQEHILQKLRAMNEALAEKKDLVRGIIQEARHLSEETRHQEELEEMLSHVDGIEHDHQELAQRILEFLDRRRS